MHVHSKFGLFCFTEMLCRLEMLVPYIRDLVRETKKQLNFLTVYVCMRHVIVQSADELWPKKASRV